MVKLSSSVHPKDVPLRMHPLALHMGPYGDVLRTSGPFLGTSLGRPRDIISPSEKLKNGSKQIKDTHKAQSTKHPQTRLQRLRKV